MDAEIRRLGELRPGTLPEASTPARSGIPRHSVARPLRSRGCAWGKMGP